MYPVKIEWLTEGEGGRKQIPSLCKYYPVARFPEDLNWPNNAWSVVFELTEQKNENGKPISIGFVDFLMDTAPKERMIVNSCFEIYEGPKKVANVFLSNHG